MRWQKVVAVVALSLAILYFVVLPTQPVVLNIGQIHDFNAEAEALRALSTQLRQHPGAKRVKLVFHLWSARQTSETGYIEFRRDTVGYTFNPGNVRPDSLCRKSGSVVESHLHEWAVSGYIRGQCS